jgi:hypothetical protein
LFWRWKTNRAGKETHVIDLTCVRLREWWVITGVWVLVFFLSWFLVSKHRERWGTQRERDTHTHREWEWSVICICKSVLKQILVYKYFFFFFFFFFFLLSHKRWNLTTTALLLFLSKEVNYDSSPWQALLKRTQCCAEH